MACGKNAGKMFFACNVKNIYACGKNVFYRIGRHPPEAAGAARRRARPGGRNGTPCGRERRPAADTTACGRTPSRANGNALAGEHRTPQSRAGTKARGRGGTAIMHRNQDAAGPALARCSVLPLPSAHVAAPCCLAPALAPCSPLPALVSGSGSALPLPAGDRSGPLGVPDRPARAGGAKRTWAAHRGGLRPRWSLGTHYASLRVCPKPCRA